MEHNEIEYQEMPNPVQCDMESCADSMDEIILEEVLELEEVA